MKTVHRAGWLVAAGLLLGGATWIGGGLSIAGGFPITLTGTAATNVTLPAGTYPLGGQAAGGTASICGAGCMGKLTVNMAVTTDQAITIGMGTAIKFIPGLTATAASAMAFLLTNCGSSNTSATGAIYRSTGKTVAVTAVTTFSGITGTTTEVQRVPIASATTVVTPTVAGTIYFAMTVAGTGTCDLYMYGAPLI